MLPLMVGIIAGAYSSIAVCSPLYYDFNGRRKLSKYEKQVRANMKNSRKKTEKEPEKKTLPEKADDTADEGPSESVKEEKTTPKKTDSKRSKRYVKGNKNKG